MTESNEPGDTFGYELVMPFVACKTQGGPYDDDAFTSGYRLGGLEARLELAAPPVWEVYVNPADIPQLDLICMRHSYSLEPGEAQDEWVPVTLRNLKKLLL